MLRVGNATGPWTFGRTSIAGSPFFNDHYSGKLAVADFQKQHCAVSRVGIPGESLPLGWIAVVQASKLSACRTVASVARALQNWKPAGPAAVVLIAAGSSHLLEWDITDGDPREVEIPTLWLSEVEAINHNLLSTSVNGVFGELQWGFSADDDLQGQLPGGLDQGVIVELWANLADVFSMTALIVFAEAMRPLRDRVRLKIHWILALRPSKEQNLNSREVCRPLKPRTIWNTSADLYVACTRVDESISESNRIPGEVVLQEIVRQKCFERSAASEAQWEFLERLGVQCFCKECAATKSPKEAETCTSQLIKALGIGSGIDHLGIDHCSQTEQDAVMQEVALTPKLHLGVGTAARIDGWIYSGPFEAGLLVEMVCGSLKARRSAHGNGIAACEPSFAWQEKSPYFQWLPLWPDCIVLLILSVIFPCIGHVLIAAWNARHQLFALWHARRNPIANGECVNKIEIEDSGQ